VRTESIDASDTPVIVEQRGQVLLITLNRPEAMNAVNGALADGLGAAVRRLDEDPGVTIGVLTGAGRGFSAGMDLKAFARGENFDSFVEFLHSGASKPLVAAVEGFALAGGLEIALCCDLIVASEGARFGIPEVTVGLFAAGGALFRLPMRVGFGKAMEMALAGTPLLAAEAAEYGLVNRLTEKGRATDAAIELA
jgi:enoyl-CoA hydratase